MRPYLQHGRRHAPTGTDPIPGLGPSPWAYIPGDANGFVNITAGQSKILTMDMTAGDWYTNAPSTFTSATHVASGSTYTGIAVEEAGHYLIKAQLELGFSTGTGEISAVFLDFGDAVPAAYGSKGRVWTRAAGDSSQDGWYLEALITANGSDTFPDGPHLVQVHNGTAVTINAFVDMIAVQMDADETELLG